VIPQVHPQPETYWGHVNPIGPRGVYDEAKRYAEALTMAYHRQQGVDTAIARIFNTYGPRMRPHDGRAIPTLLRQALENKPLTVFGDGSQTRSFCYVDDLVGGLYGLAASGEHLPINLGNPNEMSLLQLAETVIRVTGSPSEIVFEALPVDDPQVRQPDITRARQILGWEPGPARRGPAPHRRGAGRRAAHRRGRPPLAHVARRRAWSIGKTAPATLVLNMNGGTAKTKSVAPQRRGMNAGPKPEHDTASGGEQPVRRRGPMAGSRFLADRTLAVSTARSGLTSLVAKPSP
jgi:hypothetical protein